MRLGDKSWPEPERVPEAATISNLLQGKDRPGNALWNSSLVSLHVRPAKATACVLTVCIDVVRGKCRSCNPPLGLRDPQTVTTCVLNPCVIPVSESWR